MYEICAGLLIKQNPVRIHPQPAAITAFDFDMYLYSASGTVHRRPTDSLNKASPGH